MWLRDAARQEKLPTIDDLDNPKYFPYRWGQAFWAYFGARFGESTIRQMLSLAATAGDVNVAIKRITGLTTKQLSADWQAAIRKAYEPVLSSTTPPGEAGRMVIKATDLTDLTHLAHSPLPAPQHSPRGLRAAGSFPGEPIPVRTPLTAGGASR